jgi:hypothetical protein
VRRLSTIGVVLVLGLASGRAMALDVAEVLGWLDGEQVVLGGEVTRRHGVPETGMNVAALTGGTPRALADGIEVLAGDLSTRGELALVTLEGQVLVGAPGALRQLEIGDLFVTQARWSPSGDRLAVTAWTDGYRPWSVTRVRTADELARAVDSDVWLVWPDRAATLVRLTDGPRQDYNPVWSPDGDELLFVSLRTGYASFFLADAATTAVRQLTNHGSEHGAPATPVAFSDRCWWTGEGIVYETRTAAAGIETWSLDRDGHAAFVREGRLP